MKRSLPSVLAFAAVFQLVVPAASHAAAAANYVALKAGAYFPTSSDLDEIDADTGFNGEIVFGHYFNRNFALEGGVGYFSTEGSIVDPLLVIDVKEEVSVIPVTLTAKALLPAGNVEPYLEAGIGIYFADDELSGTVMALPASDTESDTGIGFHIGAGANFDLSPTIFLGAGVRYVVLEISTFGVDMSLDGFMVTGNVGLRF